MKVELSKNDLFIIQSALNIRQYELLKNGKLTQESEDYQKIEKTKNEIFKAYIQLS